jgi:phosphate transport system permease protein
MARSAQEILHGINARELTALRRWQKTKEAGIFSGLAASATFSVVITATIIIVLFTESVRFFERPEVTFREFFTTTQWSPLLGETKKFGIWALISGTMLVTVVAMAVALPLGLVTAIYLSEYSPKRLRSILKPALEVLAGIPTVVYGFFALTFITPHLLKPLHEGFNGYNAFSAGIAVGILCLPVVTSLTEDALRAVPQSLRDGALGLGGTKFDVSMKVVVPAALSGIISAFLLAIARAVGETMIVSLAAGSRAQFTLDPRNEVQTMTGFMVQMALVDVSNFGTEYYSMYAVALVLFLITLTLTIIGQMIRKRYREVYR